MESWDPSNSACRRDARLEINEDEMVPLTSVINPEEIVNQRVRLCRALEEEDLHLVAKTFFQSELFDGDTKYTAVKQLLDNMIY